MNAATAAIHDIHASGKPAPRNSAGAAPKSSSGFAKKIREQMAHSLLASLRFTWNKLSHGVGLRNLGAHPHLINDLDGLQYYAGIDEKGVHRGGNLPWLYTGELYAGAGKQAALRHTLARLPGNVSFRFIMNPRIRDIASLKSGFEKSGFVYSNQKTFIYNPPKDGTDPLAQMKADARNKINAAKRDLEIVAMGTEEYFKFYRENLAAAGKDSYFNLNIDCALVKEGVKSSPPQAYIIATRKKPAPDGGTFPIDAAIVLTGGADGYMKLLRITYRRDGAHKHAVKFLVYEAARRAAGMGLMLDTDCFTPGAEALYSRFGIFTLETRHEFQRKTMATLLCRLRGPARKAAGLLRIFFFSRLFFLIYQLVFAHNVFKPVQGIAF